MNTIFVIQIVSTALTTFLITFGAHLTSISLSDAFARGHSNQMSYLLEEAEDPRLFHFKFGAQLMLGPSIFIVNQTLILYEIMCYLKVFAELRENDQRLGTKALGEKAMVTRRKKNVLTLKGQSISFIVETGFGYLIVAIYFLRYINVHLDESILIFVLIISSNLLSFIHLCTSAELRRHYFKRFCTY